MIIGIDTGFNGGMALYSEGLLLDCCDVPNYWETLPSKTKGGNYKRRRRLSYHITLGILLRWHDMGARVIIIEKVHAMPTDSTMSAFSFGEAFGAFKGFAEGLGLTIYLVTPRTWKKHFNLIGTDKDASIELARDMFGTEYFKRKRDHNRAEAALISAYGVCLLQD